MAATPSHPSTRRGQRPLGADASHALGPDTGRRRVNFVDQHYEPWPSDSSRPTGSAPLDVEHSVRPSWRTRNAETRNNALAPEGPSPPSMYTMDSQAGSDFSIQDYFPTPEAARPSVPERRPSGLMIADEEATSPLSFGEDEPTDDPFRATVETEASAPMSGPPRSPGTGIHLAESPTSNGDRMGRGRRYDEAPTPGIFGLRRRASSLDSQTSAVADGRRRNMRRAGTPRFDSYSGVAGDLLGNCQIESPIEESDYFSFKEAANPGGRTDPHIYEEVSPKSMPVAIPEAAHTREAAQSWNNGHVEPKGKTDNNPASTNRDSLNASTITLVTPVDESKLDATPKKSFGSLSLFRRKGKDSVDDSPPGHSRQAYREKVKSMRNGEKLRPSYKRLTTVSLKREKFVLKLAKALLTFGAPSHRIESQLQSASHVLRLDARFVHFPNMIMVTFQGQLGNTNEIHFVRASGRVALTSLHRVHQVYRDVLHDRLNTEDGIRKLEGILRAGPLYSTYLRCFLAFTCASIICVLAFGGSLLDMFLAGAAASILQLLGLRAAKKSSVYANVYEITVSIIVSFAARGFGTVPHQLFCFSAISSGGVVLVLPGFTVLVSALELTAQNIMCGSVRMVYAIIYTLFLGFGLTIGSELFLVIVPQARKAQDITTLLESHAYHGYLLNNNASIPLASTSGTWLFTDISEAQSRVIKGCYRDPTWPWWRQPFPWWTTFFLVPLYSFCSSLANLQQIKSAQMGAMVVFSCAAYAANRGANRVFSDRPEMVSAVGSVVIGVCGNIWSRLGGGTAFTVMVTGVLFLVPSALGNGGGLIGSYNSASQEYSNSFDLGVRMIEVGIGVTLGLFLAAMLVYSWGGRKSVGHFGF